MAVTPPVTYGSLGTLVDISPSWARMPLFKAFVLGLSVPWAPKPEATVLFDPSDAQKPIGYQRGDTRIVFAYGEADIVFSLPSGDLVYVTRQRPEGAIVCAELPVCFAVSKGNVYIIAKDDAAVSVEPWYDRIEDWAEVERMIPSARLRHIVRSLYLPFDGSMLDTHQMRVNDEDPTDTMVLQIGKTIVFAARFSMAVFFVVSNYQDYYVEYVEGDMPLTEYLATGGEHWVVGRDSRHPEA